MNTKLTLSIEEDLIRKAKKYARSKGRSLSDLVENYLKGLVSASDQTAKISPRMEKLKGIVRLPADFDYKKELSEEITRNQE
jgi:hypothetical protein